MPHLRLAGVIGGTSFLGPLLTTADSSEFLYRLNILNKTQKETFHNRFLEIANLTNVKEKLGLLLQTIFTNPPGKNKTLFQSLTGYEYYSSVNYTTRPMVFQKYVSFVNSSQFKGNIHVGTAASLRSQMGMTVYVMGLGDFFTDISDTVINVLNNTNVLLYTGQWDLVFPDENLWQFYCVLKWSQSVGFQKDDIKPWYPYGKSQKQAGMYAQAGTVTYVRVDDSGHDPGFDKSEVVYEMASRFMNKKPFDETN